MSSSVTEEATHRSCGLGSDMIGKLEARKSNLGCWNSRLEGLRKEMALGSFIKAIDIERLLLNLETCLFLRNHANGRLGYPRPY